MAEQDDNQPIRDPGDPANHVLGEPGDEPSYLVKVGIWIANFAQIVLASVLGVLIAVFLFLAFGQNDISEEDLLDRLVIIEQRTEFIACVQTIPLMQRTQVAIDACRFVDQERIDSE